MSSIGRIVLFVSSYAPLLFLFWILESFGPGWPSTVCLVAAIGSTLALVVMWFSITRTLAVEEHDFSESRNRDADVMAYVVSYVVPFAAAAGDTDDATRLALAVFAVLIAVLYVRSAVFYVHPLLLLAGIHVYEANRRGGVPAIVLTRRRHLLQHERLSVVPLGQNVYVEGPK